MEHSEKFEKVRDYYRNRLWSLRQIYNAVGKWITEDEYEEITGKTFKKNG